MKPIRLRLLSYESQKAIISKLDFHQRHELWLKCSSLRAVIDIVPLTLHFAAFDPIDFEVDGFEFKVGIVKKYNDGNTPESVEEANRKGGVRVDVDRYGLPVNQERYGAIQRRRERQYQVHLKRLRSHSRPQNDEDERRIAKAECCVLPFQLKKNNEDPPFTMVLQVIKSGTTGVPTYEHLVYNKTIEETKNLLMRKLFGEGPLYLKTLRIGPDCNVVIPSFDDYVDPNKNCLEPLPRLPIGRDQLVVKNLIINSNVASALDAVRPILSTERPLDTLLITWRKRDIIRQQGVIIWQNVGIANDPIIATAKFLKFARRGGRELLPGIGILNSLRNSRVHLECCSFDRRQVTDLVRRWKNSKVTIGNYYTIDFFDEKEGARLVNHFKTLQGAQLRMFLRQIRDTVFPECIIVPLDQYSQVTVWCQKRDADEAMYCVYPWIMKIKIQSFGDEPPLF